MPRKLIWFRNDSSANYICLWEAGRILKSNLKGIFETACKPLSSLCVRLYSSSCSPLLLSINQFYVTEHRHYYYYPPPVHYHYHITIKYIYYTLYIVPRWANSATLCSLARQASHTRSIELTSAEKCWDGLPSRGMCQFVSH